MKARKITIRKEKKFIYKTVFRCLYRIKNDKSEWFNKIAWVPSQFNTYILEEAYGDLINEEDAKHQFPAAFI